MRLLGGVLDICVDEERVRLTVDVFDGNLKAIEASSFRQRDCLTLTLMCVNSNNTNLYIRICTNI
jgi:hypothetical protein